MKANKYITILLLICLISSAGCKKQYFPSDELSDEQISTSPSSLSTLTIGVYSRLKDPNYSRLRHFLQELPGDDLAWCKSSGDNIQNAYNYNRLVNSTACVQFWRQAYYGIFQANKIIENIKDDAPKAQLQLKGEALFLRALMHYDLVRIFARPYSQSPQTNLGVIVMDSSAKSGLIARSTVKQTYDFIVSDLLKASNLMTVSKSNIFASKEAAFAMLSRMYLYMEQNDKAIEYADKVLSSNKFKLLTTEQLPNYYKSSPESNPETIFAIKYISSENLGKNGIGSLYCREGWGEIYVSETLKKLIYKNAADVRIKYIDPNYVLDASGNKIVDPAEPSGYKVAKRSNYPMYYSLKYTLQDNTPLLYSPVVIRLAEMYLNKAEAFAKTPGQEAKAIEMVNIIRQRAGLSDQLFSVDNLRGYTSVLDAVLDERRLELAWEGQRSFDVFRNNRVLDRSFTLSEGWSGPRSVSPNSPLIVPFIPEAEINLNPALVQNP